MADRKFQLGDLVYLKSNFTYEDYKIQSKGYEHRCVKFQDLPTVNKLEVVENLSVANVGPESGDFIIAIRGYWYNEKLFELFVP